MISWIIKTEVYVICRSRRLRQITQTRGFDNSWYHAKTEFNDCFIIHFSHNSSSETEAKRSAILFLRRTLQGASNQADVELDMINVISAADITFHVKFTSYCELIECSRPIRFFIVSLMYNNKQLLDEVEHNIMNYQNRGLCYLPKLKAEADNTDTRFW